MIQKGTVILDTKDKKMILVVTHVQLDRVFYLIFASGYIQQASSTDLGILKSWISTWNHRVIE